MSYFEEAAEPAYTPRPFGPRKPRPVTDYNSSLIQWLRTRRPRHLGSHRMESERPSLSYIIDALPPLARLESPVDTIPVRHLHQSIGKSKKPITVVRWTPEGRRLLTGGHTGEFMLWNGTAFNFETVMDAHYDQYQAGVTSATWSHSHDWLISGGQRGDIKYWRPNFNNVQTIEDAHHDAVRDLAWSPNDTKFLSASDDTTLKIWDFASRVAETTLTGHGWDAKSCDWHPTKGLLVSGSKDHQVKFWDPRSGRCLTTLHSHKNTVTATKFSRVNSNMLATASRDATARIFDLRTMRDICILRGHEKPISSLTWHPIHSSLVSTGGEDGCLHHYLLDEPNMPPGHAPTLAPYDHPDPENHPAQVIYPAHRIPFAHGGTIWTLDWHPLGHILASGSKDNFTRFWSRARPGETTYMKDRFHIGEEAAEAQGTYSKTFGKKQAREEEEQEAQDEAEGLIDQRAPPNAYGSAGMPGSGLPGMTALPGIGDGTSGGGMMIPGIGGAVKPVALPPPPMGMNGAPPMPPIDPSRLAAMFGGNVPPPPIPPPGQSGLPFPIPPPGAPGGLPPNIDIAEFQKMFPGGFPPPPNGMMPPFPPPPPPHMMQNGANGGGFPGMPGLGGVGDSRKRGPLPSQDESLKAEQKRGNYRVAR